LSTGYGTNAIWTFVAPMLAMVLVSQGSRRNCKFNHNTVLLQEKFLSVSLDHQCAPDTGPS